jgi:hypothetical protein
VVISVSEEHIALIFREEFYSVCGLFDYTFPSRTVGCTKPELIEVMLSSKYSALLTYWEMLPRAQAVLISAGRFETVQEIWCNFSSVKEQFFLSYHNRRNFCS